MESFEGRCVTVIGAGRSGISATHALASLGARVLLADSAPEGQLDTAAVARLRALGACVRAGLAPTALLADNADLVVTSPGVLRTAPALLEAGRRGIPIWSEVELAYRLARAPIVAVTGTNGKTTTTLLIGAMLEACGMHPIVAGNISADEIKCTLVDAAMAAREKPDKRSVIAAEISSFQLEWVERFAPHVGVLTNLTPDHLNRYDGFGDYTATKARMFAAQRSSDFAVLNADDAATREIGESILPARRIWFTRSPAPPDSGPAAWIQDGVVCVRLSAESDPMPVIEPSQLPASLSGRHSLENVLGAAAAVCALGCRAEAAAEAVRQFGGVPHRMEIVTERLGVRYINNSMCTNVAASVSSLESLDRPAVVIAGGADKGLDYAALTPALAAHAKHLILIGEAAAKMENVFREGGYSAISRAADMASAVACARSIAIPGDAVLLCPTCASFDMFRDFEARGAAFRTAVLSLTEGPQ